MPPNNIYQVVKVKGGQVPMKANFGGTKFSFDTGDVTRNVARKGANEDAQVESISDD